ncbi:nitroreductase family protein [Novosphingobium colocasiae]
MIVSDAVASRRTVRSFLDTPVDLETVTRVLDRARMTPSGCNFQPWLATVLTGEPLRAMQDKMLAAKPQDPIEYSFFRTQRLAAPPLPASGSGRADVWRARGFAR